MSQKFKTSVDVSGSLTLSTIDNSTINTGKFIVSDNGVIKYRTASELLSDIGAQSVITNPVTGTGTTNYLSKFTASGTIGNSLIFDDGTNVGIGTTSPSAALNISGTTKSILVENQGGATTGMTLKSTRSGWFQSINIFGGTSIANGQQAQFGQYDNGKMFFFNSGNFPIGFYTNGTEKLSITDSGNVGIGTTSPSEKLDVNGNVKATGFKTPSGTATQFLMADGSTNSNTYAKTDGTNASGTWGINISGNASTASSTTVVGVHSSNEVNLGGGYTGGGTLYVNYNDGGSYTNMSFYNGGTSLCQLTASQFNGALSGNAATATTLQTARTINGTSFNGSANITTANWGTGRTITIGSTGKTVDGSGNVSWTLAEIGAQPAGSYAASSHTHDAADITSGTLSTARLSEFINNKYTYQTNSYGSGGGVYMPMVKGGLYASSTSTVTGRLRIKLPSYRTDMMISFIIDVYEYDTDRFTSYYVSGYNYSDAGATWYNTSAIALADSDNRNLYVRFGADTANSFQCVSIGETDTSWTYPQVVIRDVMGGYSTETADILNTWTIEFVTTDGVSYSHSHITNQPIVDWSRIVNAPSTFTPSSHTHDDRYYTEGEVGNFFSGATAITGYNKSNWDTAFGWGNHASAGYATQSWVQSQGYITGVTNISGYSGTLIAEDNRTIAPSELAANRMKFGFTSWNNNNTSPYADFIHLRSYQDSSGGSDNLVMFRKDAIGMRIYQQTFGSSTAYSSYKDVAFTDSSITGNAATATTLQTARTLTIGATGKTFNGSANVAWTLAEIGAQAALTNPITGTGTANYLPKFTGSGTLGDSVISQTAYGIKVQGSAGGDTLVLDKVSGASVAFNVNGVYTGQIGAVANDLYIGSKSVYPAMVVKDNGNVGIGTTSASEILMLSSTQPVIRLEKQGLLNWRIGNISGNNFAITVDNFSGTPFFIQHGDGNVGIGTNTPTATLEVSSSNYTGIAISRSIQNAGVYIQAKGYDTGNIYRVSSQITFDQVSDTFWVNGGISFATASSGSLVTRWKILTDGTFQSNGAGKIETSSSNLTLNAPFGDIYLMPQSTKNVGIGTISPSEKLDVNGNIKAIDIIDQQGISIYLKLKTVNGNVTIDNSYHNKIVRITASCTITIPAGLRTDFNCTFEVIGAYTAQFVDGSGATTSAPFGRYLKTDLTAMFYCTGTASNYRLNGSLATS